MVTTSALIAETSLEGALDRIVQVAAEVIGARYAAVGVLGPDGRLLERFVTHDLGRPRSYPPHRRRAAAGSDRRGGHPERPASLGGRTSGQLSHVRHHRFVGFHGDSHRRRDGRPFLPLAPELPAPDAEGGPIGGAGEIRTLDPVLPRRSLEPDVHVVTYVPPADPVEVLADASLVAFALDQVLDNALRHTAPGTPVEVRLMASAGGASIVVEDDGEGVPEEELAHLFEPFYRGDPARGRAGCAGLGLTTVATIVREHHGRAVAEPGDRGGLRVTIELPASSPEPALISASSS